MTSVRAVTVAGDLEQEAEVARKLDGGRGVELVLRCLDRSELLAALRGARIDVVVVVGTPRWLDAATLVESIERSERVVALAADPLEAESLRRMGLEPHPLETEIFELLRSSEPDRSPEPIHAEPPAVDGRLIAVWGPKGAPGRSTIAAEIACEIAAGRPDTILVDGDTYGGDLAQMFAVVEEVPTIVWAAQTAAEDRLDLRSVETMLRRTSPNGPILLPGIDRSELWTDISRYGWTRLLDFLTRSFAFTVVDVGFGLEYDGRVEHERDRLARQTVSTAAHVVAICRADPVGIKSFLWAMQRLKTVRDLDDVLVIANRVASGEADEVRYILKKHLGKRPLVCLANRPADARDAVDRGIPIRDLKPNGEYAASIREIAAAIGADVPARGFLARLGGRA